MNSKALSVGVEGSKVVLYFTHDYLSMTHSKNQYLKATAQAAREGGVEKLIAVCPIEYDLYYTEDYENPETERLEAEQAAFDAFPNMVLLRPNLTFGDYSYFVRYLQQSVLNGTVSKDVASESDYTKYYPVHLDDLTTVMREINSNYDEHKGKTYSVAGADDL